MQITSNIFQVGGPSDSHGSDAAVYLIKSGKHAALIDAGTGLGIKKLLKNIERTATDPHSISFLFITHCHYDHTGGANGIREHTGCTIVAHELDAFYLENGDADVTAASWYGSFMEKTSIDIKVQENKREFTIGSLSVCMYHTPGHSPGSSVYTVVSDGKLVLFGQDVHGPLNEILLSNRTDYERSLEFMISMNADILCEGHFGVMEGKNTVKDFIESYL